MWIDSQWNRFEISGWIIRIELHLMRSKWNEFQQIENLSFITKAAKCIKYATKIDSQ